jgi:hypothetical protein
MVVGLITTYVVSSNLDQSVQHHVIKFVSDLRHFGGFNHIGGVMVSVFASSVVVRVFELRSGQII